MHKLLIKLSRRILPTYVRHIPCRYYAIQTSYVKGYEGRFFDKLTVGHLFDQQVDKYGDATLLTVTHQKVKFSWNELKEKVDLFALGLLNLGLCKGDRIGVWLPNGYESMIVQFAAAKTGVIAVNIHPAFRASELERALNLVGCKVLIVQPIFKNSDYVSMLRQVCPELDDANVGDEITCKRVPSLKYIIQTSEDNISGMMNFSDVFAEKLDEDLLRRIGDKINPTDPVSIQFTSGTTGLPKAATLTHINIINNAYHVGERMRLTENDSLCLPVPLYHSFGAVLGNLACISHGTQLVYPSAEFDAEATLKAIHEEKCTAVHGVPTMFISQLNHPNLKNYDLSSLRTGIIAGAICPPEVVKQVITEMHCPEITTVYGMTETTYASFQTFVDDTIERKTQTVGKVLPYVECKVVNKDGEVVPVNTPGELWIKGYHVMKGYWNEEAKTKELITPDGFVKTGDLVTIDEEGYCKVVGRAKDVIIRGGQNVAPREVEDFLRTHPKIEDVTVVGIPDKVYGELSCAWIITKKGQSLTETELQEFCRDEIANFKIPDFIHFVDSFPTTVTGKVQKYIVRDVSTKLFVKE